MLITDARNALADMLGDTIPPAVVETALAGALTWDSEGRKPGDDDYIDTYDVFFAAAEVADQMALRDAAAPQVTSWSSESTSMQVAGPNWAAMAHAWRLRSPLARAAGYGRTLGEISVNTGVDYVPTSLGVYW